MDRRPGTWSEGRKRGTTSPVRATYAAVYDLEPEGFERAGTVLERWVREHPHVRGRLDHKTERWFSIDRASENGLVAKIAVSQDEKIMVAKLVHRETDIPERLRRIEASIERDGDGAWIAVRCWYSGPLWDKTRFQAPSFVKELWEQRMLWDIYPLDPEPWRIEKEADGRQIAELIRDPDREMAVVLVGAGAPITAHGLAQESAGTAHVAAVSEPMGDLLRELLGWDLGLRRGEIRTCYPLSRDGELVAPVARPETIVGWQYETQWGPEAFRVWLSDEIGRGLTKRLINDPAHRSYEEVREGVGARTTERRPRPGRTWDDARTSPERTGKT